MHDQTHVPETPAVLRADCLDPAPSTGVSPFVAEWPRLRVAPFHPNGVQAQGGSCQPARRPPPLSVPDSRARPIQTTRLPGSPARGPRPDVVLPCDHLLSRKMHSCILTRGRGCS